MAFSVLTFLTWVGAGAMLQMSYLEIQAYLYMRSTDQYLLMELSHYQEVQWRSSKATTDIIESRNLSPGTDVFPK